MKVEDLDVDKVKARYGGSFPAMRGKKYRYPKPENEEAWMKLVCKAMNYRERQMKAAKAGRPFKRDYRLEYVSYHCRPDQIKRRAKRNLDRKRMQQKNGSDLKGKHVHHLGSERLTRPVVLTKKQHIEAHKK